MAVTHDQMDAWVEKALRKRFTRFDGWDLADRERKGPDFTFTLRFKNQWQKVICLVNHEAKLSPQLLTRMHEFEKSASGKDVRLFARIIALPDDIPVSPDMKKRLEKEGIELLRIPRTLN